MVCQWIILDTVIIDISSIQLSFKRWYSTVESIKEITNSNLCDNSDEFTFPVVNFPFISSNNPALPAYYISQLTRYSRAFVQYSSFLARTGLLKQNLLKQGLFLDLCKKLYGPPLLK